MDEPIHYWAATAVAEGIRRREITPVEVFEAIARRIEAVNPRVNAYCTLDLNRAREAARDAQESLAARPATRGATRGRRFGASGGGRNRADGA
jgi:aspartyl-tRNA(Asn)/glutamyl-tRNA(Gln) amidotransferase subunit A